MLQKMISPEANIISCQRVKDVMEGRDISFSYLVLVPASGLRPVGIEKIHADFKGNKLGTLDCEEPEITGLYHNKGDGATRDFIRKFIVGYDTKFPNYRTTLEKIFNGDVPIAIVGMGGTFGKYSLGRKKLITKKEHDNADFWHFPYSLRNGKDFLQIGVVEKYGNPNLTLDDRVIYEYLNSSPLNALTLGPKVHKVTNEHKYSPVDLNDYIL